MLKAVDFANIMSVLEILVTSQDSACNTAEVARDYNMSIATYYIYILNNVDP
jgi:hypothetical protein